MKNFNYGTRNGAEPNLSDIKTQSLVPKSINKKCSVEQFLIKLRDFDQDFFKI